MSKIWVTKQELRTMIREACEMCEAGHCSECEMPTESCECDVKTESRGARRAKSWKAKKKGKESPARGSTDKWASRSVAGKTKAEKDNERKHKEQLKDE